jgi:hypothetical protein
MTSTPFNGKGSNQRPVRDRKQFEDNWDKIFGNKDKPKDPPSE